MLCLAIVEMTEYNNNHATTTTSVKQFSLLVVMIVNHLSRTCVDFRRHVKLRYGLGVDLESSDVTPERSGFVVGCRSEKKMHRSKPIMFSTTRSSSIANATPIECRRVADAASHECHLYGPSVFINIFDKRPVRLWAGG